MSSPKLPEPFRKQGQQMSYNGDDKVFFDCYTIAQMKDYGELCRQHALDEAIALIDILNGCSLEYCKDRLMDLKG